MCTYESDSSGISSLGGFAYQIKVFAYYALLMKAGMVTGFETLDDVTIGKLAMDSIDKNEDKFRCTCEENSLTKAIQVKHTNVGMTESRQILFNWMLLENSENNISDYILFTDDSYQNKDEMFQTSVDDLFELVTKSTKGKRSSIGKVKNKFGNSKEKFCEVYEGIKQKYTFISVDNLDKKIDELCEVIFKKPAVNYVTYILRIKELLTHITVSILDAINEKQSFLLSYEELMTCAEEICLRCTDTVYHPQYAEFKKTHRLDLAEINVVQSREYKQLCTCKLPDRLIEQHLMYCNYYKAYVYSFMELNRQGDIRNIEEVTYENYENVKFGLQCSGNDTPYNRLEETKRAQNSYAEREPIKYGSAIYLTREGEYEHQISWEDEENAEFID